MRQIVDALLDAGDLGVILEVLEHITVDNRRIDAAHVKQIVYVLGDSARDDRDHTHIVSIVDDPRELGRKSERRAFRQAGRQTYGALVQFVDEAALVACPLSRCLHGEGKGCRNEARQKQENRETLHLIPSPPLCVRVAFDRFPWHGW